MKYLVIMLTLIAISYSSKEIKTLEQNQVEIKEFIVYEKEEKKPFTGKVISKYQTEQLKNEISYKNGQRDGCSKYYYSNGQIKSEKIFKKGKIKSWRDYKENGILESSYYSGDNFFVETFKIGLMYIFMPFLN